MQRLCHITESSFNAFSVASPFGEHVCSISIDISQEVKWEGWMRYVIDA